VQTQRDAAASIPALAAALCTWQTGAQVISNAAALQPRALAPMYRLTASSVEAEAHAAAKLVTEVAERLRRLKRA
jgi:hypothetical protein